MYGHVAIPLLCTLEALVELAPIHVDVLDGLCAGGKHFVQAGTKEARSRFQQQA
jgi:hypothetical protein